MVWSRPTPTATADVTVGGSCLGSPTSTAQWAPRRSGMTRLGSVACVASSRATAGKVVSIKRGSAAAVVVQHTTSAQLKTSFVADISRLLISWRRSLRDSLALS